MWYPLLEFGSVTFWGFVFLCAIVEAVLVEVAQLGWGLVSFLGFIAFVELFTTTPVTLEPGTWIRTNIGKFIAYLGCYILIGLVYSLIRWWWFLKQNVNAYVKARVQWLKKIGIEDANEHTEVPPDRREIWKIESWKEREEIPNNAREHWDRITGWVMAWPLSLVTTIIRDPVRMTAVFFVAAFSDVYHAMAKNWFKTARIDEDTKASPIPKVGASTP